MQIKHLIIFALVGMAALLGFNLISGNQHEKSREAAISSTASEQTATDTAYLIQRKVAVAQPVLLTNH